MQRKSISQRDANDEIQGSFCSENITTNTEKPASAELKEAFGVFRNSFLT